MTNYSKTLHIGGFVLKTAQKTHHRLNITAKMYYIPILDLIGKLFYLFGYVLVHEYFRAFHRVISILTSRLASAGNPMKFSQGEICTLTVEYMSCNTITAGNTSQPMNCPTCPVVLSFRPPDHMFSCPPVFLSS